METNLDLDINNYTTTDLINFFKLEENYKLDDLLKREQDLAIEILSINNKKYDPKYKFDIINFIKTAKEVLISFYQDMETNKEIKKNIERYHKKDKDTRIGKIINPLAPHQALEDTRILNDNINGYDLNRITSTYVFNTSSRNNFLTTSPTNSMYELPVKWNNVISIQLSSCTIPNVMYAFDKIAGTNQIYIEEDGTGLSALVTLPDGNYLAINDSTLSSFPFTLTKVINEQVLGITNPALYRFFVNINLPDHKTTIYNTINTFTMKMLNRDNDILCSPYSNNISFYTDYENNSDKVPLYSYLQTMGYLMGFRSIKYSGSKSYTSESIFINVYSTYLYFAVEDYTNSQTISNTYGILGKSGMLDGNILALIPITSEPFTYTFEDSSNFIYSKRRYFGPVDISRISVKLLNQVGNIVNLNGVEFNFSLKVETIYNLTHNK